MNGEKVIDPMRSYTAAGTSGVGVVVIHGFTSNPGSMFPWALPLNYAGHAISVPRLPGHATSWEDLATVDYRQWVNRVEEAYDTLAAENQTVAVAGLSMGGTLATHLGAVRRPAHIFLVNPAITYPAAANAAKALKRVVKTVPSIGDDIRKPGMTERAYSRTPVAAVEQMSRLVRSVQKQLPAITAPITLFRSAKDHVVPDSSMARLHRDLVERTRNRVRYVPLPDSYHVATLDYDATTIAETTLARLDELAQHAPWSPGSSIRDCGASL